jgi:protein-arginine kinase activator protein McsA
MADERDWKHFAKMANEAQKPDLQQALRIHDVIGSVCPTCNAKGYRTTLTKNSYACKKCGTWWAN